MPGGAAAYVKFVDDQECLIVKLGDIKKFEGRESFSTQKKYNILYTDGHYYPACILYIGDSEKQVKDYVNRGPRLKCPPTHLLVSATETERDDSITPDEKKKKKKKKKGPANDAVVLENYNQLTEEVGMSNEYVDVEVVKVGENPKVDQEVIKALEAKTVAQEKLISKLQTLNIKLQEEVLNKWKDMSVNIRNAIDIASQNSGSSSTEKAPRIEPIPAHVLNTAVAHLAIIQSTH